MLPLLGLKGYYDGINRFLLRWTKSHLGTGFSGPGRLPLLGTGPYLLRILWLAFGGHFRRKPHSHRRFG